MLVSNTSERLQYLMNIRKLKQIDILNKCLPLCDEYNVKMGRNHISQYVSGKVKPNQDKLSILAMALDVSEAWLMGYDVPMSNREDKEETQINTFAEKEGKRTPKRSVGNRKSLYSNGRRIQGKVCKTASSNQNVRR